MYGLSCENNCSSRNCNGSSGGCHGLTGQCVDGCKPGWFGQDCTKDASKGIYWRKKKTVWFSYRVPHKIPINMFQLVKYV